MSCERDVKVKRHVGVVPRPLELLVTQGQQVLEFVRAPEALSVQPSVVGIEVQEKPHAGDRAEGYRKARPLYGEAQERDDQRQPDGAQREGGPYHTIDQRTSRLVVHPDQVDELFARTGLDLARRSRHDLSFADAAANSRRARSASAPSRGRRLASIQSANR